jgi:periplasmic protein TonB
MKNPIAHEVSVIATGARPGENSGQRKLFMEEASTVLAFENGGMIRLSAAVAVGQLLFLTNKGTRREVVAQVKRKRDFRPTSCYVEVEFSEPSAGFWGIEFPEMPELPPANAPQAIADQASAPARAPSAHEVTALRREVEALREQLKLWNAVTPDVPTSAAATAPRESAALPIDRAETSSSEEDLLPKPALDFEEAQALAERRSKLKQKVSASRRPGALRIGLLSAALLLVAAGAAWYQHRLSWQPQPKKFSSGVASSIAAPPGPAVSSALQKAADAHSNSSTTTRASAAAAPKPSAASHDQARPAPAGGAVPSTLAVPAPPAPGEMAADAAVVQEKSAAGASAAKRAVRRPSSEAASEPAAASLDEAPIVPPKLINSVRAIAPPDALRDFVTGNVTLDAVVDPAGQVKSMKVLSGPASFHTAAMNALKQYRYEPATQLGRPVAAHITVTINFWFEP